MKKYRYSVVAGATFETNSMELSNKIKFILKSTKAVQFTRMLLSPNKNQALYCWERLETTECEHDHIFDMLQGFGDFASAITDKIEIKPWYKSRSHAVALAIGVVASLIGGFIHSFVFKVPTNSLN